MMDWVGATIDTERESEEIGQTSAPFHINCSSFLIVGALLSVDGFLCQLDRLVGIFQPRVEAGSELPILSHPAI